MTARIIHTCGICEAEYERAGNLQRHLDKTGHTAFPATNAEYEHSATLFREAAIADSVAESEPEAVEVSKPEPKVAKAEPVAKERPYYFIVTSPRENVAVDDVLLDISAVIGKRDGYRNLANVVEAAHTHAAKSVFLLSGTLAVVQSDGEWVDGTSTVKAVIS